MGTVFQRYHREQDREPPQTPGEMTAETRLDVARLQVDQVTDIMRGNMSKIMEREGKLENLQSKADKLHSDSQMFQKSVIKVKRRAWLENMRTKLAVAGTVGILLIILASVLAYSLYRK